jgi:hypothetical protein
MPNSYGQLTQKELHFKSLEASAEIAEKASLIALERDWPIEKATNYVRKLNPNLAEMEVKGYVSEQDYRSYTYTSKEAGDLLAEKATELMRSEKIPYDIAITRVYADPENEEIMRCYAQAD